MAYNSLLCELIVCIIPKLVLFTKYDIIFYWFKYSINNKMIQEQYLIQVEKELKLRNYSSKTIKSYLGSADFHLSFVK